MFVGTLLIINATAAVELIVKSAVEGDQLVVEKKKKRGERRVGIWLTQ